jgi:hypothetical protein
MSMSNSTNPPARTPTEVPEPDEERPGAAEDAADDSSVRFGRLGRPLNRHSAFFVGMTGAAAAIRLLLNEIVFARLDRG